MKSPPYMSKAKRALAAEVDEIKRKYREGWGDRIAKARERYLREKAENAKNANEYGYIGTLRGK